MLKRITVEEALNEKERMKKEIEDAIENMHIAVGLIEDSGCLVGSDLSKEEFEKKAKEDYRYVHELIKKYWEFVEIIAVSDATTYIETHCGKMTIARAKIIRDEYKKNDEECFIKKIIVKLNCEYVGANKSIANWEIDNKTKVFHEMSQKVKRYLTRNDKELLESVEEKLVECKGTRFDPLDINRELIKYISLKNMLPYELRYLICESNQHTFVEVDC